MPEVQNKLEDQINQIKDPEKMDEKEAADIKATLEQLKPEDLQQPKMRKLIDDAMVKVKKSIDKDNESNGQAAITKLDAKFNNSTSNNTLSQPSRKIGTGTESLLPRTPLETTTSNKISVDRLQSIINTPPSMLAGKNRVTGIVNEYGPNTGKERVNLLIKLNDLQNTIKKSPLITDIATPKIDKITPIKTIDKTSTNTEQLSKEKISLTIDNSLQGDKTNTINTLLAKENLSLGKLLEGFGSKIRTQILESQINGKKLSKETTTSLEKELTPDRMNNLTIALSDKVISKLNDSLAKIKNNKEDGPAVELSTFNALKTFLQEGNIDGVKAEGKIQNALKENIVNADPARSEIKIMQKNLKDYVILNKNSLAGFDSYANTQTILEGCKTKIPETPNVGVDKTIATPEQIKETTKKFGELVKDIPDAEGDKKELTEKGVMKKMDAFFDKNPWAKEVLGFIKDIFQGTKLGQWLGKFLGDKYGVDIDKALSRPLVKENTKTYLDTIAKLGDKDPAIKVDTTTWKPKTDYFRLQNNVVYHKDNTGNGVLESYNPTTKEVTPLDPKEEATTYEKNHIIKGAAFSENSISQFMLSDIHAETLVDQITTAAISKYPDKTGNNKAKITEILGQKYKTKNGDIDSNKVGEDIKTIAESKKYLYSSEDLVAEVISNNLQQLEGEKAKAPTIKVNPDTLKIPKDQAITPDTLAKFFKVENGFGKNIVFTTSDTPNTQNVGPQTINVNVFVDNVPSVVPVQFTVEATAVPTATNDQPKQPVAKK